MINTSRYPRLQQEAAAEVPGRRLLGVMFLAGVTLFFCLAQLHLQFALKDVRRETTKQQARKMELKSELNSLRSDVESHKRGEKLLQYAEANLGMVHYPTGKWEHMTIAAEVEDRYRDVEIAGVEGRGTELRSEKETAWVDKMASKLEMATAAFAKSE